MTQVNLRDYQKDLISKTYKLIEGNNDRLLIYLPTGGGKTELAVGIVEDYLSQGKTVLFVVDRVTLVSQTIYRFNKYGIECGVIKYGYRPDPTKPFQIASIQTLRSRSSYISADDFDLIVIDECHKSLAESYDILFENKKKIIGLTATPFIKENHYKRFPRGLHHRFDTIVKSVGIQDLINMGHLVTPDIYTFNPKELGLDNLRIKKGEFDTESLEVACNNSKMIKHLFEQYMKLAPFTPALTFACSINHSIEICQYFNSKNITAAHIDCNTSLSEREEVFSRFKSGELKIISSVDVVSEGFDMPEAVTGLMARPTVSQRLYFQQLGRLLRPSPGKKRAIIIDQACNYSRFSHPCDYLLEYISLDPIPKKIVWIKCPKCGANNFATETLCRRCGATLRPKKESSERDEAGKNGALRLDDLEKVEATPRPELNLLIEVNISSSKDRVEKILHERKVRRRTKAWVVFQMMVYPADLWTESDFKYLANKLGYKQGWGWYKYRDWRHFKKTNTLKLSYACYAQVNPKNYPYINWENDLDKKYF